MDGFSFSNDKPTKVRAPDVVNNTGISRTLSRAEWCRRADAGVRVTR
jgi:hypothetical protein